MIDPGSFRDPAGVVLHSGARVLRAVTAIGAPEYLAARDAGVLSELVRQGQLVDFAEIDPATLGDAFGIAATHVLEHSRLPFISYPYEWSFAALQAAAICHLEIHMEVLASGFTLSDATAFNIQFDGAKPIFIDHLSIRRYRDGEFWLGHRQFCEQFLNPLLLRAMCGVPHQAWYRGNLHGIPEADLAKLLPWPQRWSPLALFNVTLPAFLQKRHTHRAPSTKAPRKLPKAAFQHMLSRLRAGIENLEARRGDAGIWTDYVETNTYAREETNAKKDFIHRYVSGSRPDTVWDLGCNTGEFAQVCLDAGAQLVIGFDNDPDTLDVGFRNARARNMRFLPLYLDLSNPSPAQGWRACERAGLAERDKPDGVIALALLHHLVIRNNIPMTDALDWVLDLAPSGIVEFVPKNDPMVQRLLALREDIFPNYTREVFLAHIARKAKIVAEKILTADGRLLIQFEKLG